jgi:hypothetical protein
MGVAITALVAEKLRQDTFGHAVLLEHVPVSLIQNLYISSNAANLNKQTLGILDPQKTCVFLSKVPPFQIVGFEFHTNHFTVKVKGKKSDRIFKKWTARIADKFGLPPDMIELEWKD